MDKPAENARVAIPEAARQLGLSPQGLRMHMRHGMIGHAEHRPGCKTWTYFIYQNEIDEFKRTGKWRTDSADDQAAELLRTLRRLIAEGKEVLEEIPKLDDGGEKTHGK